MKVKRYLFLCIMLIIVTVFFVMTNIIAEMTITYFPIDYDRTFTSAESSLTPTNEQYTIDWASHSTSEDSLYLRQDVSLLFRNGALVGVLNKWLQNTTTIEQKQPVTIRPNAVVQTISFHHGERHDNETITSIQAMSTDELYMLKNNSFKTPKTYGQTQAVTELDQQIKHQLHMYWEELMNHFNINEEEYSSIPLTEIVNFDQYLSDTVSEKASDRIIGQLWEGLYKNYILAAVEANSNDFMPIILLANDQTHLFILYKI